jgi:DNA-binding transcriptional ArsR family regulator
MVLNIPSHVYTRLGILSFAMMATLRALAEPHHLQIVDLLLDGPRPVGDMVIQLGLRQPQVSKHLRVLTDAGLVDVRMDAQRRIYALRPIPFQELKVWLEKYGVCGKATSSAWMPCLTR